MLKQFDFYTALKFVSYAMPENDTRYILNGVLVEYSDPQLRLVATDGHRVNVINLSAAGLEHLKHQQIIKATSVKLLLKLFKCGVRCDDEIQVGGVTRDDWLLSFTNGTQEVAASLIDGNYVDYRRVLPDGFDRKPAFPEALGLSAKYLKDALTAAQLVVNNAGGIEPIKLKVWDAAQCTLVETTVDPSKFKHIQSPAKCYIMPVRL